MNVRQVKSLAVVLFALLAIFFAITLSENQSDTSTGGLLFPDLKAQINDISQVSVSKAGESLTANNRAGKWVLAERQDYPVDTGKLRQLLLSLADAKKLEEKTSNAEMYAKLGVEDVAADSQGSEVRLTGPDMESSIIIGNLAQGKYRYVRIPGETTSWLVNQNPTLPGDFGGWLLPEILNIDSTVVQSVTITHSDGETIRIGKEDSAVTDYTVSDIPRGRELSYPSVVDSIAGVLSKLTLEDVTKASEAKDDDSAAKTVFVTFDGLEITVESSIRDDKTWITVSADQRHAESDESENVDEAKKINEQVNGWAYQIQSYKADQLRRRWDDILKAENQ